MCCFKSFITVFFVFFGFTTCTWIDFLQFADGKRCFLRIFSFVSIVKINQFRLAVFQFCNDQPHLQSPVSKMYITDHFVSDKTSDTFDTLPNDRRTKMTYMKWFCNIRSAVVDNDRLRFLSCFYRIFLICCHFLQVISKKFFFNLQIDKSRLHNFCHRKDLTVFQMFNYIICDHKWRFLICFGSCHGSIALKFT